VIEEKERERNAKEERSASLVILGFLIFNLGFFTNSFIDSLLIKH